MNFSQISHNAIEATNKPFSENKEIGGSKKEELPSDYDIHENPEIEKAYNLIKGDVPVIFLTGGAGTGKSTFIKYLKNNLKSEIGKNCVVLAPTGVAAINVGGQTIHNFFGFKFDPFEHNEIKRIQKNSIIDHTDLIIIDEISMVHSWMLDHIDYALRLWCDKDKPFGGKQMLLIGDCFQLPPVVNVDDEAAKKFYAKWESQFFFAAKVFENVDVKAIQLTKIYRQKDLAFVHMLNRIRECKNGYENDINFLNQNCFIETRLGTKNVPEECLLLSTTNANADEFNEKKMFNLKQNGAKSRTFEAFISGDFNFNHVLTPRTLELCIGARVMVTKNINQYGRQILANGDMGKVVNFGTDKNNQDFVEIEVKGRNYNLTRETWQSFKYHWNEETKSIQQNASGSFTQIPLKLGWAVTIHKSQGLTLDAVAIDAENAWDSGQVYVALSRVKNLNGLLLCQEIPVSSVKTDEYVKKNYEQLFPKSDDKDEYNADEYKNIKLDNSQFTVDKSELKDYVNIGGLEFKLYPEENEKIQPHVQRTMARLLANNLIPQEEMNLLLYDKNYCYETFGISYKNGKYLFKYPLLVQNDAERYDDYGRARYWAQNYSGYYICSQWYQNLKTKFAQWLIALSDGKLKKANIIELTSDKINVPYNQNGHVRIQNLQIENNQNSKNTLLEELKEANPEIDKNIRKMIIHSDITVNLYKIYLLFTGYSKNTIVQYANAINGVLQEENIDLDSLVQTLDSVISDYDSTGLKSYLGEKGHKTWINSLKRFREFIGFRKKLIEQSHS